MTPRELAEKICDLAGKHCSVECDSEEMELVPQIESLLSAALEEAKKDAINKQRLTLLEINRQNVEEAKAAVQQEEMNKRILISQAEIDRHKAAAYLEGSMHGENRSKDKWLIRGKIEAYEDCAKIAEYEYRDGEAEIAGMEIAAKIRAKAAEVGQ